MVVDPLWWTMMSRPDCVERGRGAASRLLAKLVVQRLVEDLPAPQTFQLVSELFDAGRDFFWQLSPG